MKSLNGKEGYFNVDLHPFTQGQRKYPRKSMEGSQRIHLPLVTGETGSGSKTKQSEMNIDGMSEKIGEDQR